MDRRTKRALLDESLDTIRGEIVAEKAAALGRISRMLDRQIFRLQHLEAEIEESRGKSRAEHVSRYESLRRQAQLYRWYLEVQREAVGFIDHRDLDRLYPIPGPIAK